SAPRKPTRLPFRQLGSPGPCWHLRRSRGAVSILRNAGPEAFEAATAREKAVAGPVREQGSMYHICPAQCQIQLRRAKQLDHGDTLRSLRSAARGCGRDLLDPVRARIGRMDEGDDFGVLQRRLD